MIDAIGLARNLGIVAVALAFVTACLAGTSTLLREDNKVSRVHLVSQKPSVCPSYSMLALASGAATTVLSWLALLAYGTERPSAQAWAPIFYTKAVHRLDPYSAWAPVQWHLGMSFFMMLGGSLIMLAACLLLVTVSNSKKIFLIGGHQEMSASLLMESERKDWDEPERGAAAPGSEMSVL